MWIQEERSVRGAVVKNVDEENGSQGGEELQAKERREDYWETTVSWAWPM